MSSSSSSAGGRIVDDAWAVAEARILAWASGTALDLASCRRAGEGEGARMIPDTPPPPPAPAPEPARRLDPARQEGWTDGAAPAWSAAFRRYELAAAVVASGIWLGLLAWGAGRLWRLW